MVFDYLVKVLNGRQVYDEEIPSSKLIIPKFYHVRDSEVLCVIMPPWGVHLSLSFLMRIQLAKKGISTLEFELPKAILSTNWKYTLNNFIQISDVVSDEIDILRRKYLFKRIVVVGLSIGCINACMISNNNRSVNEVKLIVPGHCLAESMWNSMDTKKVRRAYENQGISLEKLKKYWSKIAPQNNINNMKSKKISVFLSKHDKVIPFYSGMKLLDALKSSKYDVTSRILNHKGHSAAILEFYP